MFCSSRVRAGNAWQWQPKRLALASDEVKVADINSWAETAPPNDLIEVVIDRSVHAQTG